MILRCTIGVIQVLATLPLFAQGKAAIFPKAKALNTEHLMPTWYDWPGDDMVRTNMSLKICDGGSVILTSTYGQHLTEQGKSRLCWATFLPWGMFHIDAENGEPVRFGVSSNGEGPAKAKGETSGATRPRSPSGASGIPSPTPAKSPQTSGTQYEPSNQVWIARGAVAFEGVLAAAWKGTASQTAVLGS